MSTLDRYEFKFLINHGQRDALLEELSRRLRPDASAGAVQSYPVVTLYYDNAHHDCYWERATGLRNRRKLRVRIYGREGSTIPATTFLEIKHKSDGRGAKRRIQIPLTAALSVGTGDPAELPPSRSAARTWREASALVRHRGFEPVCVMRYERQALTGSADEADLRVTIDSGLHYRMTDLVPRVDDRNFEHQLLDGETSIMEIKVLHQVPYWLSMLVAHQKCLMQGYSKYSSAIEAGSRVATASKYERTL